jgi:hypothetical protein
LSRKYRSCRNVPRKASACRLQRRFAAMTRTSVARCSVPTMIPASCRNRSSFGLAGSRQSTSRNSRSAFGPAHQARSCGQRRGVAPDVAEQPFSTSSRSGSRHSRRRSRVGTRVWTNNAATSCRCRWCPGSAEIGTQAAMP